MAGALVLTVLVALLLSALQGRGLRLPAADMVFAAAETEARSQRIEAQDDVLALSAQFRPRQSAPRRYHASVESDRFSESPHALFVPHLGQGADIYVNGARAAVRRSDNHVLPGRGASAALYAIRRFEWLPGRNRVDIYVAADPTRAGLGPVFLGPEATIRRMRERHVWMDRALPRISWAVGLFGALIALGVALAGSPQRVLFFRLALIAGLHAWVLASGSVLALVALTLALAWLVATRARHSRVLSILGGVALAGPVLALLRIALPVNVGAPTPLLSLMALGPLPLLAGPALVEGVRLARARRGTVDRLQRDLDAAQTSLEEEIGARAVFEERERLTRDIHDGVGGQLLALLLRLRTRTLPQADIARDLQAGLNDLRLVVDALDHTGNDLGRALAAFRDRAEAQLDAAGIALTWRQTALSGSPPEARNPVLDLYRLLQEALTNVIRHSGADRVAIDIQESDGTLRVAIRDDGDGRAPDTPDGRGSVNMRQRASLLGGSLVTEPGIDGRGHGLVLSVPLGLRD